MSERKESKYREKVKRGDMMYGTGQRATGCCAHRLTLDQVERFKRLISDEGIAQARYRVLGVV